MALKQVYHFAFLSLQATFSLNMTELPPDQQARTNTILL